MSLAKLSRPSASLPAAAAALLSSLLSAQQEAPPLPVADVVSPIRAHQNRVDEPVELWGGGRNYKASFHDGAVYYPHVGPDLPHQPVRWKTTSIHAGGVALPLAERASGPKWTDQRCEYDLGPAVECYDVRVEGLAQSFVFERPVGEGEIVIRGQITSPLTLGRARQDGISLTLPDGTPVVHYGAAIVFDAAGRRAPVRSATAAGHITLTVDEAFMREATFPVVVDPLISNDFLETGAPMRDSDVLHESLSNAGSQARTWVLFSRQVAAGDQDIWIQRFATNFGGGTPRVAFQNLTTWSFERGRIALAAGAARTVAVFEVYAPGLPTYVAAHAHDVDDLVTRTTHLPTFGTGFDTDTRPDVGGRHDGGDEVLIVFQRDDGTSGNTDTSEVRAGVWDASIGPSGMPSGSDFLVKNRPNRDQERPDVNRSAAGPVWLVAFQGHDGTVVNDDWDIAVQAVSATGTVSPMSLSVEEEPTITQHKIAPRIAGADGRYCLAYVLRDFELPDPKPTGVRGESLRMQRIDWDHGADVGSRVHAPVTLMQRANPNLRHGWIAFDHVSGSHWCVTSNFVVGSEEVIEITKLGYRGRVVESETITSLPINLRPGGVAFNSTLRRFLTTFGADGTPGVSSALRGVVYGYDDVAPATTYGFACGSGVMSGVSAIEPFQQIGSQGMRIRLASAPQNGTAILIIAFGRSMVPLNFAGLTGCEWLTDPAGYVLAVNSLVLGGGTSFRLDLPEATPPLTLNFQWIYPAQGANPANLLATEGLEVEIGR